MKCLESHPEWPAILHIADVLKEANFQVVLAGGCVRDALLGRMAKDLDVATDAKPEEVEALFPKVIPVGKNFGVCRVLHDGVEVEVATFREESGYQDGRRPDEIVYSTMEKDAFRRDFTMNGMFYDFRSGQIVDLVKGQEDIRNMVIRCVGVPEDRFAEDHLRILRGVRFAAQLEFEIEESTWKAMGAYANQVSKLSRERLRDELHKAFCSQKPFLFFELSRDLNLLEVIFPGWVWESAYDCAELGLKKYGLWEHLHKKFSSPFSFSYNFLVEPWVNLGLHYIRCGGDKDDLKSFFRKMKLSGKLTDSVLNYINCESIFIKEELSFEEQFRLAKNSDFLNIEKFWSQEIEVLTGCYRQKKQWDEFKSSYLVGGDLAPPLVTGKDLISLGHAPGPGMKSSLDQLYVRQIKDGIGTKEQLLATL